MDIAAPSLPGKTFKIEGETSLKQESTAFQDILLAEASDTPHGELIENPTVPLSVSVTKDSGNTTEKADGSGEPVPRNAITEESASTIKKNDETSETSDTETPVETITYIPLYIDDFKEIKMTAPKPANTSSAQNGEESSAVKNEGTGTSGQKPAGKETDKTGGEVSVAGSEVSPKENLTPPPPRTGNPAIAPDIRSTGQGEKLNSELPAPSTKPQPQRLTDMSTSFPVMTGKYSGDDGTKPLENLKAKKADSTLISVAETDPAEISPKKSQNENHVTIPKQRVNGQKVAPEQPLSKNESSKSNNKPSSTPATVLANNLPDITGKLPYGSGEKKDAASKKMVNTQQSLNIPADKNELTKKSAPNISSTPNKPAVTDASGQPGSATILQENGTNSAAELPLREIQSTVQKKNVPMNKKNEKKEDVKEKPGLFSILEEEPSEKGQKTLPVNHAGKSMKEDFAKQKLRQPHPAQNGTLVPDPENSLETSLTDSPNNSMSADEPGDQKRFQAPGATEKRNTDNSQATRKETAGYLFRKIESFIKTGKNEFSLRLYPETLGTLQIKINSDGELLKIHMTAQSHISKNVIESTLNELKTSLAEKGFQTDQLSVTVGRDGSFSNSNSGNPNMNNRSQDTPRDLFHSLSKNNSAGEELTSHEKKKEIVSGISNVNIFV